MRQSNTYRFSATTDDGMRVYVDNNQIIDVWYDSQAHTVVADVFLSTGNHALRVEYYNAGGVAVAGLDWWLASASTGNWQGEYFNNMSLSGAPALVRRTPQINYNWTGSPGSGVSADQFSARWTSNLPLTAGQYRFSVTADDGVRLWVNNQLVIDQWREQQATTYNADLAEARLEWTPGNGSTPSPSPPTTAVPGTAVMTGAIHLTVRSGPSLENEAVGYLSNGQVVTLLGRDAFTIWIKIREADGTEGWVSGRFLMAGTPLSNLPILTE